jgi:hypothetical protein
METIYQTSFDQGFYDYKRTGELTCPNGWTPQWVQGEGGGVLHRPEYDAKDREKGQPEVRTGRYAANFFTVHATHDGCLYRRFKVGKGKLIRAAVWCMNVSNSKNGKHGGHGMQIGIDPLGGQDHTALTVKYGEWWSSHMEDWKEREWRKVEVEVISQTDEITVFLHAKCDYPADINASHWDDLKIETSDVVPVSEIPDVVPVAPPSEYPTLQQIEEIVRRVVQEELAKLTG